MASQTENSGFNRRLFLAGAAGGAMLPAAAHAAPTPEKPRGIYAHPADTPKDKVAQFSYQDVLAQLIVEMWTGAHANLIAPATTKPEWQARSAAAKAVLENRGINLAQPIVITEDEYEKGFSLEDAGLKAENAVVLVLPRRTRTTTFDLETAKMLMAITPNGMMTRNIGPPIIG
jgi:hypothetical protein